jgi:hypothetical protein
VLSLKTSSLQSGHCSTPQENHHIISYHIISYDIISYHIISSSSSSSANIFFWQQCFHRPSEVVTCYEPVYYYISTVSQCTLYIYCIYFSYIILYMIIHVYPDAIDQLRKTYQQNTRPWGTEQLSTHVHRVCTLRNSVPWSVPRVPSGVNISELRHCWPVVW